MRFRITLSFIHFRKVHHLFRVCLECPVCGLNMGPEFRSDRAVKHLRGHGLTLYALPPWAYGVAEVEVNPNYRGQAYVLPIAAVANAIECNVQGRSYVALHIALQFLWELGLHRQLNLNVMNIDEIIVPLAFEEELRNA